MAKRRSNWRPPANLVQRTIRRSSRAVESAAESGHSQSERERRQGTGPLWRKLTDIVRRGYPRENRFRVALNVGAKQLTKCRSRHNLVTSESQRHLTRIDWRI